jgi:3-hydroxyacyl-CoA dehydrogenase
VFEDDSVRIWHSDDDVLVISLKTKMHVIGDGVINGINAAWRKPRRTTRAW